MHIRRWLLVLLCVLSMLPVAVSAQTITGSVGGTVTDQRGAVIRGATVVATNIETNVSTSVRTNDSGVYDIRFLQVGQYTITIEASGFARQQSKPFTLEAAQNAKLDSQLSLEGTTTSLSVSA